jgi:hypothetical protein
LIKPVAPTLGEETLTSALGTPESLNNYSKEYILLLGMKTSVHEVATFSPGNPNRKGRISTVDLLI